MAAIVKKGLRSASSRKRVGIKRLFCANDSSRTSSAPKANVIQAATKTGLALGASAFVIRLGAATVSDTNTTMYHLSPSFYELTLFPSSFSDVLPHTFEGLCVASAVYFARQACNRSIEVLKSSSDEANAVVLPNLDTFDILLISALSGCSEELLFRWALMPVVSPDLRGAAIAAAVFGALHLTGGRNLAFASWATAVGFIYGATALHAGDAATAAIAHTSCNFISGVSWKQSRRPPAPPPPPPPVEQQHKRAALEQQDQHKPLEEKKGE